MLARLKKYFLRVVCVFVGLGPLFAGFPIAISTPQFALAIWIVGAVPALLAALYYFAITCWWFDAKLPTVRFYRTSLYGMLGAVSGMLGTLTYSLLPITNSQFVLILISRDILFNSFGVIGGMGSAVFVRWLYGRPGEQGAG